MNQIANFEADGSADRQRLERSLRRLKFISRLRYFGLPTIALSAAVAAVIDPLVFPIVAFVVAAIIGGGEFIARRERIQLDVSLSELKNRYGFDPEEAKRISLAANIFTVAGSSN